MAFFYTDFSEYGDLTVPGDWTLQGLVGPLAPFEIVEICEQSETDYGFKVERGKGTLGNTVFRRCSLAPSVGEPDPSGAEAAIDTVVFWHAHWDDPGTFEDGEIYARIRAQDGAGIVFRSGYVYEFLYGSTEAYFRLVKHFVNTSAAVGGFLYTFPQEQGSVYQYDWYNVRIQFIGTAIKMKIWRYGAIEPDDWDIEDTDATYVDGEVGFSCSGNALLFDGMDCLAVEDSATPSGPFPPPGDPPDPIEKPSILSESVDIYGNVTLESSVFSGDASATHINSRWQVDLDSGDFSEPLVDTQYELGDSVAMVIPTLPVESYKARMLQRDSFEQESSWSSEFSFSVTGRAEPANLDLFEYPGDVWIIRDLVNNRYKGLISNEGSVAGPGGSGAATLKSYYDPGMGRSCIRLFVGGTNYQATYYERFGVNLVGMLSVGDPRIPYTYIIGDMARVERILISQAAQAPARSSFTGVHHDQGMNRGAAIGGNEYLAIGFRTKNGSNWKAYMTTFDIGGGGALIKDIDTGIGEEEVLWWRIELDGWNKQIRWYVEDVLVTSYTPQAGDMDDFAEAGLVGGNFAKGEHVLHYKGHPINIAYREPYVLPVP
jgi:hypothetical protein